MYGVDWLSRFVFVDTFIKHQTTSRIVSIMLRVLKFLIRFLIARKERKRECKHERSLFMGVVLKKTLLYFSLMHFCVNDGRIIPARSLRSVHASAGNIFIPIESLIYFSESFYFHGWCFMAPACESFRLQRERKGILCTLGRNYKMGFRLS